jgi:tRNA(Phe) wybutosine-synthesizing methylase Tyw3
MLLSTCPITWRCVPANTAVTNSNLTKFLKQKSKQHSIGQLDNSLSHLVYLLTYKKRSSFTSQCSPRVVIVTTKPLNLKTWYERCATEGHSNAVHLNYLQLVPKKWRGREILIPQRY